MHDLGVAIEIISKRIPKQPNLDDPVNKRLWGLCLKSWNHDPKLRITAKEALIYLGNSTSDSSWTSELPNVSIIRSSQSVATTVNTDQLTSSLANLSISIGESSGNSQKGIQSSKRMIHLSVSKNLDLSSYTEYSIWTASEEKISGSMRFPVCSIHGNIFLTSNRFPSHLKSKWSLQIYVDEDTSNYQILRQIYSHLFTRVDDTELKSIRPDVKDIAKASSLRRCMDGLRRVDFLGKYR